MNDTPALEAMQAELSILSDQWDFDDGSPDTEKDEKFWKESEELLNDKEEIF